MNRFSIYPFAAVLALSAIPAHAQFDPAGRWTDLYHEDELERTDPGPSVGDYLGLPINEAERRRGDSWEASLVTVPEHQCIPHPATYGMRGPANLVISTQRDPVNQAIIAYVIEGTYGRATRTIWMDGRPHPGEYAAHTWAGFSTGYWEGNTLTVETDHVKAGYLRRNGIAHSDMATVVEHFDLHDKYLTVTSIRTDQVYLTEPLIQTETWVWNPYQAFGGYKCESVPEIVRSSSLVPHHLPGTNNQLSEFSELYGVPEAAARGGAETMYPEYRKKLKQMTIPKATIFESMGPAK
jgi:hypothetical protein